MRSLTRSGAGVLSPATFGTSQNDYNPTNLARAGILRVSPNASVDMTGLVAGEHGDILKLVNISNSNTLTLKNESASSTAANRFMLRRDLALAPGDAAELWYDETSARWRCINEKGAKLSALTQKEDNVGDAFADLMLYYASEGSTPADRQRAITPFQLFIGNRRNFSWFFDDLYSSGLAAQFTTGTGSVFQDNQATGNHPGVMGTETGTGSTGGAGIGSFNTYAYVMGGGRIWLRSWHKTPSALSDGTNRYSLFAGLTRSNLAYAPSECIAFRYVDNVNTGKWQLTCRNSSTESNSDSGVTVAVDTWYLLDIDINAGASSVTGYINGTACSGGPITTNIPTAESFWHAFILKSLGTTNRKFNHDAYGVMQNFTTAR